MKKAHPEENRVALIGPIAPYRGGISHYTTQLYKALSARGTVYAVSFKRQYPKWLYPGKSDIDEGMSPDYREKGVNYTIDAYSPLSWRRTADDIVRAGCSVAILNWWTLFWQPGFAYIAWRLRRKGVKTVYLCHNLKDHKTGGLKGMIFRVMQSVSRAMLSKSDGYIVHAPDHVKKLKSIKPGARVMQRLHPIYDRFPRPNEDLPRRGRLEVLFFGFIRPYKGLESLIDAVAKLNDKKVYLTIVGEPWGDEAVLRDYVKKSGAPNIELHLGYADDQTVANYFARADVVALPYLAATGSGVVTIAYHYGKPVVASRVSGLSDAVAEGETGWLVAPKSPKLMAATLEDVSRDKAKAMKPAIERFCKANDWDSMAKAVYKFAADLAKGS